MAPFCHSRHLLAHRVPSLEGSPPELSPGHFRKQLSLEYPGAPRAGAQSEKGMVPQKSETKALILLSPFRFSAGQGKRKREGCSQASSHSSFREPPRSCPKLRHPHPGFAKGCENASTLDCERTSSQSHQNERTRRSMEIIPFKRMFSSAVHQALRCSSSVKAQTAGHLGKRKTEKRFTT